MVGNITGLGMQSTFACSSCLTDLAPEIKHNVVVTQSGRANPTACLHDLVSSARHNPHWKRCISNNQMRNRFILKGNYWLSEHKHLLAR